MLRNLLRSTAPAVSAAASSIAVSASPIAICGAAGVPVAPLGTSKAEVTTNKGDSDAAQTRTAAVARKLRRMVTACSVDLHECRESSVS